MDTIKGVDRGLYGTGFSQTLSFAFSPTFQRKTTKPGKQKVQKRKVLRGCSKTQWLRVPPSTASFGCDCAASSTCSTSERKCGHGAMYAPCTIDTVGL